MPTHPPGASGKATPRTYPKVDGFLRVEKRWQEEMRLLRTIVLGFGLEEGLKWRFPCYGLEGANVVLIHGFKEYCALFFFKGALLKDPKKLLSRNGSMQSGRQFRFTSAADVVRTEATVKAYVREAIGIERAGMKVELKKTSDFPVPAEFEAARSRNAALKAAFDALTPGRQRAYLLYFSDAKQPKTREARVEKCVPKILRKKGLTDED